VYGPRQRPDLAIHAFARKMVEGKTLTLFGDGTQARDYTYCDDIVAGVLAALRWTERAPVGVETFNLGGNRTVPIGAMVEEIAGALGLRPKIEWAPMQPGDVQRTAADLTKSGAMLGYAPRTPFPEGVRRFVNWFREVYGRAD
jgi:UDP-glucuronate 4-epimerase